MKGLIIKDFYYVLAMRRQFMFLTLTLLFLGFTFHIRLSDCVYILLISSMIGVQYMYTLDYVNHFHLLLHTMPYNRADFIKAKNISMILLIHIGFIASFLLRIAFTMYQQEPFENILIQAAYLYLISIIYMMIVSALYFFSSYQIISSFCNMALFFIVLAIIKQPQTLSLWYLCIACISAWGMYLLILAQCRKHAQRMEIE